MMDIPAAGGMLGTVTHQGIHWMALIQPYEDPAYVYVNVLCGSVVDGLKRPIRREYAHLVLTMFRFPDSAEWVMLPNAKPWTFNNLLFASHEAYIREAILGDVRSEAQH